MLLTCECIITTMTFFTISTKVENVPKHSSEKVSRANNIETSCESVTEGVTGTDIAGVKPADHERGQGPSPSTLNWRAGRDEWMVVIVLAIVSVMVALDATILVPVLPVSGPDCLSSLSKRPNSIRS